MSQTKLRHPNEIFVGDLSFFCQESHLEQLFQKYCAVAEVRIKRSDRGSRTLMYGFVRLVNMADAVKSVTELNGLMFMGRRLR